MSDVVTYEWVKGRFEGDHAKKILALAGEGVGYFLLDNNNKEKAISIVAAFKRPLGAIPPHLEQCNNYEVEKLEQKAAKRLGVKLGENRTVKKDNSLTGEIRSKIVVQWVKRGGSSYMDKEAFIKKVCEAKGIDYAKI